MRTGAIFARGSCRALKWVMVLGILTILGGGQAAAQRATFTSAVVKGGGANADNRTVVVSVAPGIRLAAPGTPESIESAFTLSTGNTVDSVTGLAADTVTLATEFEIVFVTFLNGTETLTYTPPASGGLVDATGDIAAQEVDVDPVDPRLNPVQQIVVETGTAFSHSLPEVAYGGKQPITYELRNQAADGTEGPIVTASTVSIHTLNTAGDAIENNSGLYFTATSRTISGRAQDVGTYPLIYTATSAPNNAQDPVPEHQVHFSLRVVAALTTPASTGGRVTAIVVGDPAKDAPRKTIGGQERVHVAEGLLTTVKVTVRWTNEQITALRRGGATPPAATVGIRVVHVNDPATWLSPAETSERPGTAQLGGYDAVLATTTVTVPVPTAPTTNPNSRGHYKENTGTTRLSLPQDIDAEEEAFAIHVVSEGSSGIMLGPNEGVQMSDTIVIEDDEPQGIELSRDPASTAPVLEGGNDVMFKAVAKPPREDLPLQVRYNVTDSRGVSVSSQLYTLTGSTGTIPVGDKGKDNVTFTTPENDEDREDIDLKVHAEVVSFSLRSGAFDDIQTDSVDLTVLDIHKLPVLLLDTVMPMTADVEEGGEVELTMQIDRNPANTIRRTSEGQEYTSEPVTVMFSMGAGSTASAMDYEIMTNPVEVPKHNGRAPWTQDVKVTIMASSDQVLDDMEMLVLAAEIDGTENGKYGENTASDSYAGVSTLTIEDDTAKLVWAKTDDEVNAAVTAAKTAGVGADDMFTAGEMVKIMGSALFGAGEGVTLSYSAKTSDPKVVDYSVSNGEVTVTAMGKGDAMITITAHASMPAGVTINKQTDPGEASIDIPFEVGLEALTIELEGPDAGMNLVEGMEYTITAKANRAVEMDTMVELVQTDGTASPADYEVESITIMMGESMGTTKLMVKDDGMMENEGDMTEMLTLEGRIGAMKTTNSLMFYLWDAAVPALPVIAQLLLAALMALGGYRRYLRR